MICSALLKVFFWENLYNKASGRDPTQVLTVQIALFQKLKSKASDETRLNSGSSNMSLLNLTERCLRVALLRMETNSFSEMTLHCVK